MQGTSKTTTCTGLIFDSGHPGPYHTRPMAAGLPDLVDCLHLAGELAELERIYELGDLPRLKDLLADPRGTVQARFAFAALPTGRPGAAVTVHATPHLICQRCMQDFVRPTRGGSDVEFAPGEDVDAAPERELYRMEHGRVSLRDLAEEELLLALPIAPMCATPATCGRAPSYATGVLEPDAPGEMRRPFSSLQDLLKKT